MPISDILGYARAFVRGPTLDTQKATLLDAGIIERRIYVDVLPDRRQDGRVMWAELLLALRAGDTLAVHSLGIFGRNNREVRGGLAALDAKSVRLWSIGDELDLRAADPEQLYKLNTALNRAERLWNAERTARATIAARRSGRSGRRFKLPPSARGAAALAWKAAEGPDAAKTNAQLAAEYGLSPSRMHALFGARADRRRDADS